MPIIVIQLEYQIAKESILLLKRYSYNDLRYIDLVKHQFHPFLFITTEQLITEVLWSWNYAGIYGFRIHIYQANPTRSLYFQVWNSTQYYIQHKIFTAEKYLTLNKLGIWISSSHRPVYDKSSFPRVCWGYNIMRNTSINNDFDHVESCYYYGEWSMYHWVDRLEFRSPKKGWFEDEFKSPIREMLNVLSNK